MRRTAPVLITLLVAATIAIDAVCLMSLHATADRMLGWAGGPDWPIVVLMAMMFAQVSLVTLWVGLGSGRLPWKIAALASVTAIWSTAFAAGAVYPIGPPGYGKSQWWLLLVYLVVLLLFIAIPARTGCKFVDITRPEPQESPRRLQFSLGSLLAWVAAIAISVGVTRWVLGPSKLILSDFDGDAVFIFCGGSQVMAVLVVWVVFGRTSQWYRLLGLGLTAILAALLIRHNLALGPLSLLWPVQGVWLVGSLLVVRIAGVRLVPTRKPSADAKPQP